MDSLTSSYFFTSAVSTFGSFSQALQLLGIDIGQFIPVYFVVYALYRVGQYLYDWSSTFLLSHLTSYIEVDDWDLLYNHLMDWASAHKMTKLSRELRAVTFDPTSTSASDTIRTPDNDLKSIDEGITLDVPDRFDFQKWYSKNPLIYKPNFSSRFFVHSGNAFHWSSSRRSSMWGEGYDQVIVIRCFGRSTKPIKDLLNEVKGFTLNKGVATTGVYRSSVKGENSQWLRQSIRPSRPMHTISLDEPQKAHVILDINEYVQPCTARWYATRGIPYRRGYLFYGPPGSGKTSLSFALAGFFGLSIYGVSLNEISLTESHLATLFGNLPQRCIILLEDIDTAGVRREGERPDIELNPQDEGEAVLGTKRPAGAQSKSGNRSLISLAGLLNIIDSVTSQEGRVLIMTTNRPGHLDSALIRPGRVDLQIRFTLATRDQIRDMYLRMYHDSKQPGSHGQVDDNSTAGWDDLHFDIRPYITNAMKVQPSELGRMAEVFANKFDEETFSLAEIQGFLLERKKDPEGALREAESWIDKQVKAKEKADQEKGCIY